MWETVEQDSNSTQSARASIPCSPAHATACSDHAATKAQAISRMALSRVPGIGVAYTKKLIAVFGDAAGVFRASKSQLRLAGLHEARARAILEFNAWEQLGAEWRWLVRNGVRLLYFTDPDYPQRLQSIADAPPLLFYRGNADLNAKKIVAVVGTRNADDYGKHITAQLIAQMQPAVPLILSGLARGIDAAAHKAALGSDLPTVGVLGHGLGMIYPAEHAALYAKMVKQGGLLTSFGYDVKAERYNFPIRNLVVAGLCDALVVVQTALKGGSMITLAFARQFGKKIFVVPGRLSDRRSQGCNQLIRQGIAQLLSSGEQLTADMGWTWPEGGKGAQAPLEFGVGQYAEDSPEGRLLRLIREKESPGIDELILCSRLDASAVALLLLQLELRGMITALPGKRYMLALGG